MDDDSDDGSGLSGLRSLFGGTSFLRLDAWAGKTEKGVGQAVFGLHACDRDSLNTSLLILHPQYLTVDNQLKNPASQEPSLSRIKNPRT